MCLERASGLKNFLKKAGGWRAETGLSDERTEDGRGVRHWGGYRLTRTGGLEGWVCGNSGGSGVDREVILVCFHLVMDR